MLFEKVNKVKYGIKKYALAVAIPTILVVGGMLGLKSHYDGKISELNAKVADVESKREQERSRSVDFCGLSLKIRNNDVQKAERCNVTGCYDTDLDEVCKSIK